MSWYVILPAWWIRYQWFYNTYNISTWDPDYVIPGGWPVKARYWWASWVHTFYSIIIVLRGKLLHTPSTTVQNTSGPHIEHIVFLDVLTLFQRHWLLRVHFVLHGQNPLTNDTHLGHHPLPVSGGTPAHHSALTIGQIFLFGLLLWPQLGWMKQREL